MTPDEEQARHSAEYVELTDAERAFIASKSPANDETQGWEYALLHRAVGMVVRERMAQAWDERDRAKPQYLGPNDGHYKGCMGWEDCDCASYPNPYRGERTEGGDTR